MFCTRLPMEKSTKEFQDCCFQILLLLICGAWCSMVPLCPIATLLVMLRLRGFLHAFGKTLITSNSSNSVELQRFFAPENPPEILCMMLGSFHQRRGFLGSPVCYTALLDSYKFAIQIHIPGWPMFLPRPKSNSGPLFKMSRSLSSLDASGWDSQNASPPRHALRCLFSWFVVWFKQYGFVWIEWFSSSSVNFPKWSPAPEIFRQAKVS